MSGRSRSTAMNLVTTIMQAEQVLGQWRGDGYGGVYLRPAIEAAEDYLVSRTKELPSGQVGQNLAPSPDLREIYEGLARDSGKTSPILWAKNAIRIGTSIIAAKGEADKNEKKVLLDFLGTFKRAVKIYLNPEVE